MMRSMPPRTWMPIGFAVPLCILCVLLGMVLQRDILGPRLGVPQCIEKAR
jgi:hypothetical protein